MRKTASGIKRILEPLHVKAFCIIHQQHIEAARRGATQLGEIVLRGADQAMLFVPVNALRRTTKIGAAALPHFDEDQRAAVLHDQVNLAKTAAIVLRYQLQTLSLQKIRSPEFGLGTVQGLGGVLTGSAASACGIFLN